MIRMRTWISQTSTGPSKCKLERATSATLSGPTMRVLRSREFLSQKRGLSLRSWNSDSGKSAYSSRTKRSARSVDCCPSCGQTLPRTIHLSTRERQVVDLVGAQGMTYPQAAERLGIAPQTVSTYAQMIRDRFGTGKPRVVLALVAQQSENPE